MGRKKNENIFFANKVDANDKESMNKAYFYYCEILYNNLKQIKFIFDEEELKNFAYKFIKFYCDKFSKTANQFSPQMITIINRNLEKFNNDKIYFIKRYILFCGYKNSMKKVVCNEYRYLLDEYKDTYIYNELYKMYDSIVENIVSTINDMNINIKSKIKTMLFKESLKLKENLNEKLKIARSDEKVKKELYYDLSHIKDVFFEKLKGIYGVSDEIIKDIIDNTYDDYFEAYFKGNCTRNLRHYLCTRFSEKFNKHPFLRGTIEEMSEDIDYYYYSKLEYINNYVEMIAEELQINYPINCIKEELLYAYKLSVEKYFMNNYNQSANSYINYHLRKKIKELENKYSDKNINNLSNKFKLIAKENNLINLNILDEVIDNLTNYYLLLKVNNDMPYEIYMINQINNFNYERYLKIKQVKENVNCKILKHPSVK